MTKNSCQNHCPDHMAAGYFTISRFDGKPRRLDSHSDVLIGLKSGSGKHQRGTKRACLHVHLWPRCITAHWMLIISLYPGNINLNSINKKHMANRCIEHFKGRVRIQQFIYFTWNVFQHQALLAYNSQYICRCDTCNRLFRITKLSSLNNTQGVLGFSNTAYSEQLRAPFKYEESPSCVTSRIQETTCCLLKYLGQCIYKSEVRPSPLLTD